MRGQLLKRLGKATVLYGLGSLLSQILSFALIPVFTAFLTPEDYGVLDLAAALGTVLLIAMRLGMPGALTRFYFEYAEGTALRDYVTSLTRFVMISGLVVLVAVLLLMPLAGSRLLPGLEFWPYVVLVVCSMYFSSISDIQRRLLQAREEAGYTLRLNIVSAIVLTTVSIAMVVGLGLGAAGMLLAELIVSILICIQAIWYLRPDLVGNFAWNELRGSMRYAAGILPSQAIGTVSEVATRAILVGMQSTGALGLFALASRFARPLSIGILAFNTAYQPVYFASRKEATAKAHGRLAEATSALWLLAVWGCLATATLGPVAIVLMTPERFHAAAPLVPWLAVGWMAQVLSVVGSSEIYYQKATWFVPVTTLAVSATQIAATALLAEPLGAKGLTIASALGLWINGTMMLIYSRRLVRLPLDWRSFARTALLGLVLGVGVSSVPFEVPLLRASLATVSCVAFPAVLLAFRDPALTEALVLVRKRMASE